MVLERALIINVEQFNLYVDSAFMLRSYLVVPFNAATADAVELQSNSDMSEVRMAVQRNFKDLKHKWSANDFKRLLQVQKVSIGLMYRASDLLLNIATGISKSGQVGTYCDCESLSLTEYL